MKQRVFMADEKVIVQGEDDKVLYIIMIGSAKVYIKEEQNKNYT
jgi:CRP-like cAMP-binding protein